MECYHCGAALGKETFCPNCGVDVKIYKKIVQASNSCYNQALARANVRDLSGAIDSLKKSLRFNKKNTSARNLLGLIYFEMGEMVSALREWVISKSFQPENNIAGDYLDEIQENPARLESVNQTIKKYNQALLYCRQDSKDLAVIQLKKVLSMNSKMVQGHQLLGLLYLEEGNLEQAKKALENAMEIDEGNTVTHRYLRELNSKIQAFGNGKEKKSVSYQSGNDVIIRPTSTFKESSSGSTILNIAIGLLVGVLITCFLVVPGVRQSAKSNARKEVLEANDTLSTKNQEIKTLNSKVKDLEEQLNSEKDSSDSAGGKVATYQQLLEAYAAYRDGDVTKAGDALANVNAEYLDENSKALYDAVNGEVNSKYLSELYAKAYQNYNRLNYAEALVDFEKIMEIDENYHDGYALYYIAQSYRKNNDIDNARTYYQKVVDLYPNTERAATAQRYLNEYGPASEDEEDENGDSGTADGRTNDPNQGGDNGNDMQNE
ncbi:MAG: tetratricopeptide repeat protein [Lachnospiraceae bacterium]|nr:tetratricopeptide repeat protein [Lachnospiraceae bacterium]